MALCSNDAKSCYVHIILITVLCLCRLGADKAAVQSMIGTLHRMQHHVRSTYGNSKTLQGQQEWGIPKVGIGQGNGSSPQIWAAVSTLLFQILATEGFLAQIICAISAHQRSIVGFGFVDDTNLCVTTADNHNHSPSLYARVTGNVGGPPLSNRWGTGTQKCFWYFIKLVSATQRPIGLQRYRPSTSPKSTR